MIENELMREEEDIRITNPIIRKRIAIMKHKNKLLNSMIKKNTFPKNILKFNQKFKQWMDSLREIIN